MWAGLERRGDDVLDSGVGSGCEAARVGGRGGVEVPRGRGGGAGGPAGGGALWAPGVRDSRKGAGGFGPAAAGRSGEGGVNGLAGPDEAREARQAGVVHGGGRAANFTGTECFD